MEWSVELELWEAELTAVKRNLGENDYINIPLIQGSDKYLLRSNYNKLWADEFLELQLKKIRFSNLEDWDFNELWDEIKHLFVNLFLEAINKIANGNEKWNIIEDIANEIVVILWEKWIRNLKVRKYEGREDDNITYEVSNASSPFEISLEELKKK